MRIRSLIITPDYPPKLGGLATFSKMIELTLNKLNHEVDVFVWESVNELRNKNYLERYNYVFSIHFYGYLYSKEKINAKFINFIHGSEITFYSPKVINRVVKSLLKAKMTKELESANYNVFISNFTKNILIEKGFRFNPLRDIVFHNCIDTSSEEMSMKSITNKIILCAFVRNVPHKNIDGILSFAQKLHQHTKLDVELHITAKIKSDLVKVIDISGIPDKKREDVLKKAHLNILLSLDHSRKGFFEGFGLTVLEAGKYGVPSVGLAAAGLQESIHDGKTGWLIKNISDEEVERVWGAINSNYKTTCQNVYDHTVGSHDIKMYERLFEAIL